MLAMTGTVGAAGRIGLDAGMKIWFNDWTHDVPGVGTITSDTAMLIGPAIHAEVGSGFAEASYLVVGSEYRFTDQAVNETVERKVVDFAAGYRLTPEVGLLAGYRNSELEESVTRTKAKLSGPFIGLRADVFMDRYLAFYLGSNLLFTRVNQMGPAGGYQENSPGWAYEFGFKYSFTRHVKGAIGYRAETNTGQHSNAQEAFSGFTLSGMAAF